MKKRSLLICMMVAVLTLGSMTMLGGCGKSETGDDLLTGDNTLMVTVQEILEDSYIVEISDEYEEAELYGTLSIPKWFSHEVKVGDVIWIRHNGKFLKTSPATVSEILEMKTTDENGLTVHVTAD